MQTTVETVSQVQSDTSVEASEGDAVSAPVASRIATQVTEPKVDPLHSAIENELSERLEVGIGSYYSLYKYDLYLNAERDDVRTYHVELEYDWYEDLRVDLDYVFEDDDFGNQNTLRLGLRWSI